MATEVTLTATPAEGWIFGSWSENVVAGKVTIDGDTTVTVTFTKYPEVSCLGIQRVCSTSWDHSFHWTGLSAATDYYLEVQTSSGAAVFNAWYMSEWTGCAGGTTCAISPSETMNLANGDYQWRIQDYGLYGFGSLTSWQSFTLNIVLTSPVLG